MALAVDVVGLLLPVIKLFWYKLSWL